MVLFIIPTDEDTEAQRKQLAQEHCVIRSGLFVTESELELLAAQLPVSRVTGSWGKEGNFTQKASKLRRWWTSVLKNHLEKVQNLDLFMSGAGGEGGFEVRRRLMTTDIWTSSRVPGRWWDFCAFGQQTPVAVVSVVRLL